MCLLDTNLEEVMREVVDTANINKELQRVKCGIDYWNEILQTGFRRRVGNYVIFSDEYA